MKKIPTRRQPLLLTSTAMGALLLLGGTAHAGSVSSVTPNKARLDHGSLFVVSGSGLRRVDIVIEDCAPQDPIGTDRLKGDVVDVRCVPTLPGLKKLTLAGVVQPVTVKFDHPTRLGDPAARGVPSVLGVSSFNGNYFHQVTDLVVAGRGPAFTVSRSYNSYDSALEGVFRGAVTAKAPWRSNWDLRMGYNDAPGQTREQIFVQRPDGSGASFWLDNSNGQWVPVDQGSFERLVIGEPAANRATLYSRDGLRYVFEAPVRKKSQGRLLQVADHEGNALTVTPGANGKPASVKDSSGRVFTFDYYGGGRLKSVTDHTGRHVDYTWEVDADGAERISTVRDVRGFTTRYYYTLLTSTTPAGDRTLLTAMDLPGGGRTDIAYSDQVYGNWGVQSVARKVDTSTTYTTSFNFCAESSRGTCQTELDGARYLRSLISLPDGSQRVVRFDAAGRREENVTTVDGVEQVSINTPRSDADLVASRYKLAGLSVGSATPESRATALTYDDNDLGLVTAVTGPDNQTSHQSWVNLEAINVNKVTSRTTPSGLISEFAYEPNGRLTSFKQPGQPASTLAYTNTAQPGLPSAQTDPRNNTTSFDYYKPGYLKTTTDAAGNLVRREVDELGRVTKLIDARRFATQYEYDEVGQVTKVIDPDLRTIVNTYDAAGNLSTRKDKRDVVTTYTYDKLNRLSRSSTPLVDGSTVVTRYEYDTLGRVVRVYNPNSHTSDTAYDAAGNARTRTNGEGQATTYTYNKDGQVTRVTDPLGRWTDTEYDSAGRVKVVRTSAGAQQTYDYDTDGRVAQVTDALGRHTVYTYHPTHGRLWKVTDPLGNLTRAEYDEAGNLKEIWGPGLDTASQPVRTQYHDYDNLNRRVLSKDAKDREWRTSYDPAGNVLSRLAPGGLLTTYTYDKLGRLTDVALPDGQTLHYTLDPNGNRIAMDDATGTTSYEYDNLNRLTKVTDPRGKVVAYAYDPAGNRTALVYPGGNTVQYTFDRAERLTKVKDWLNKTTTYTLNLGGQVSAIAFGNGTSSSTVHDDSARLDTLTHTDATGTLISSQDLLREANGNIKEIAVTLPLLPSFDSSTTDMTYDVDNRLLTVNGNPVTHDAAGRITGMNGAAYTYDARDLLTSYTPATGAASTYTYNGSGHRVAKTDGSTTTRYVIDPNAELPNVLQETDGNGVVLRHYVWGYGLLEQIDAAGKSRYYHHDITGHTLALTSAAGKVTDKYAYTPYGDTTTQGTTPNTFKYAGKFGVIDENNGLHFMRARYYRADMGRFMGLDHIEGALGHPASLNRYAYAGGNPVVNVDPDGNEWWSELRKAADKVVEDGFARQETIRKWTPNRNFDNDQAGGFLVGSTLNIAYSGIDYFSNAVKVTVSEGYESALAIAKTIGQDGTSQFLERYPVNLQKFDSSDKCLGVAQSVAEIGKGIQSLYGGAKWLVNHPSQAKLLLKSASDLGSAGKFIQDSISTSADVYSTSTEINETAPGISKSCTSLFSNIFSE